MFTKRVIANDVYQHEATLADGKKETKSVLLNENDSVWAENRNLFISDAVEKVLPFAIFVFAIAVRSAALIAQVVSCFRHFSLSYADHC